MIRLLFILICTSCVTTEPNRMTQSRDPRAFLQDVVLSKFKDLRTNDTGPFKVNSEINRLLQVSHESSILADVFMADVSEPAPIIFIQHGNHSKKEAHRNHCSTIASWGIHCVALQQKNYGQWLVNSDQLTALVKMVFVNPQLIGEKVDQEKIILAGHSFGGSAVSLAIANGAPVLGGILLDPAVVHENVLKKLKKITAPIFLVGADKKIFQSRDRPQFAKRVRSEFFEISVRGATHDDAQNPSVHALSTFGTDPYTDDEKREVFTKALTANAISIAATGSYISAWKFLSSKSFRSAIKIDVARLD